MAKLLTWEGERAVGPDGVVYVLGSDDTAGRHGGRAWDVYVYEDPLRARVVREIQAVQAPRPPLAVPPFRFMPPTRLNFSAQAQMKAAARYLRERYGRPPLWSPVFAGHTGYPTHEEQMMGLTTRAPRNPYRTPVTRDEELDLGEYAMTRAKLGPAPRRNDTEHGPGITAGDLDRLARQHHFDGYAKAEREYEAKLEAMQAQLADAYDAGYTAGRIERAQGLARDVFSRLFGVEAAIISTRPKITKGPKKDAHEALDVVENELHEVREFCSGLFTPHDPEGAETRTAAHVAAHDHPHTTVSRSR